MSSLIVATFGNPFAAASAYDKLMSRGLRRRKGTMQGDEDARGRHVTRAPQPLPPSDDVGLAILTVEIDDDTALEEVMDLMRGTDALDVHILPGQSLREDDALPWPEQGEGDWLDVERAIDAALQGKPRVH